MLAGSGTIGLRRRSPSPWPSPAGRGKDFAPAREPTRHRLPRRGLRGSLSQRERDGVREKGAAQPQGRPGGQRTARPTVRVRRNSIVAGLTLPLPSSEGERAGVRVFRFSARGLPLIRPAATFSPRFAKGAGSRGRWRPSRLPSY